MVWFIVMQVFMTLLEWMQLERKSERVKDLEILLLRRQLTILERQRGKPRRISRAEKLTLVVLTARLKRVADYSSAQLGEMIRLFQPETILKWHRELVRRKWTFQRQNVGGRPRINRELESLIVRLARANCDWGNLRIQGELGKLGYEVSDETVANILSQHGIPPSPKRGGSPSWRNLMNHYKDQILACDYFTVETLFLKTLYVLVFIELGSRRVYFAGCTAHPTGAWVTQQARQLTWTLAEREPRVHFLIHDRDVKFTPSFDNVFQSENVHVILTPVRAPNANPFAERWVRTVRNECLDKVLIVSEAHLRRVLREYITYYNGARPHQALAQQTPIPRTIASTDGHVRCRRVLGGIQNDYYRETA